MAIALLVMMFALALVTCIEANFILRCKTSPDPFQLNLISSAISTTCFVIAIFCLIPEVDLSALPHFLKADNYSVYGLLLIAVFLVPFFVFNLVIERLMKGGRR